MSTTTDELHELSWTVLSSLRPPDSKPELTDTYGTALTPRPSWAIYAANKGRDTLVYVGPSDEVQQHPDFGGRAIVEVRAELSAFVGPSWVEWYLSPAMIHVEQSEDGFTLGQARELAATILRLADEVEAVESSDGL